MFGTVKQNKLTCLTVAVIAKVHRETEKMTLMEKKQVTVRVNVVTVHCHHSFRLLFVSYSFAGLVSVA